jgi:hypothetical protein
MASTNAPAASDVETKRSTLLHHETSILLIGILHYAAAGMLAAAAVALVVINGQPGMRFAALLGLLACGYALAGFMLRNLDARARYSATIMAALGMFAMPVGSVLSAYVLWLIHIKEGRAVLSPEYREVVAATPQIKCRVTHSTLAVGIVLTGVAVYRVLQVFLHR